MSSLAYRPDVDGLRAFAIVPVLLFHFSLTWIPGGFLGVDVFFVISGYLIGSILLRELADGSFRFSRFWMRRLRRITPALLAMTLVTLAASLFFVFPPLLSAIGLDALASTFSLANFAMWAKVGDYWGPGAESSPFLHTWSLSVEEQFYVFFPAFLYLIKKWRWNPVLVLTGVVLVSLAAFGVLAVAKPKVAFYMFPARAWELALGALVAAIPGERVARLPHVLRGSLTALGLLLLCTCYFLVSGENGISLLVGLPVVGAALVLLTAEGKGWVSSTLTNPVSVFVGKISYSLYLWHWPSILLSQAIGERFQVRVSLWIAFAITVALSLLSFYFIESPLRKRPRFFGPFFCLLVSAVALGGFLAWSPTPKLDESAYLSKDPVRSYDLAQGKERGDGIRAGANTGGVPQIVVVGDSHGALWGGTMDEIGTQLGVPVAFFTLVSNQPFFPIPVPQTIEGGVKWTSSEKQKYARNLLAKIDLWRPSVVVLACKWQNYRDDFWTNMMAMVRYCQSKGVAVLVIEQGPVFAFGNYSAPQYLAYAGVVPQGDKDLYLARDLSSRAEDANQHVADLVKGLHGVRLFRYRDSLIRGDQALMLSGRKVLFVDEDHMSDYATQRFREPLKTVLAEMLQGSAPSR